eukprot:1179107-Prorocentrum_minimum.AAC.3
MMISSLSTLGDTLRLLQRHKRDLRKDIDSHRCNINTVGDDDGNTGVTTTVRGYAHKNIVWCESTVASSSSRCVVSFVRLALSSHDMACDADRVGETSAYIPEQSSSGVYT